MSLIEEHEEGDETQSQKVQDGLLTGTCVRGVWNGLGGGNSGDSWIWASSSRWWGSSSSSSSRGTTKIKKLKYER